MWKKSKLYLVLASVALNVAFIAMWVAHAAPVQRGLDAGDSRVAEEAIWCPLHRQLKVSPEQWQKIEPRLRDFQARVAELCQQTNSMRSQVIELLAAEEPDLEAIRCGRMKFWNRSGESSGWWLIICSPRRKCLHPSSSNSSLPCCGIGLGARRIRPCQAIEVADLVALFKIAGKNSSPGTPARGRSAPSYERRRPVSTSRIEIDRAPGGPETIGNGRPRSALHSQPSEAVSGRPGVPTPRSVARKKRRRRNRLLLLAVVVAASATAVGSWYATRTSANAQPVTETATVHRRDFSSSVLATGAVQPQVGAEVRVGARISGRVASLKANIGDHVTRGQVIAELEKADLEAVVAQRGAEVQLAEAKLAAVERLLPTEIQKAQLDLSRWQATRTLCEQEIQRQSQLLEADATTKQSYDEANERLTVAKAEFASAEKAHELLQARFEEDRKQALAEITRARSALSNAEVQLSYATIAAPIDGVIASVATQEGETVAAGMQAPTFVTIIDLDRLQVDAYVDEVDIGKVQPGQEALFTVDTFPGREFKGQVTAIYPKAVIQDNVVNYDVVVDILDEHGGILRPEMTASVTVLLEKKADVLAVPAKAVKRHQGKNVVYLARDGGRQMREITVGWKDGQWIEILGGLKEGETVLLDPPAVGQPQS